MRGLSQLFSVLLASVNTDKPTKYSDLSSRFNGVYETLQQAHIYKDYSSTIKFSFVTPPSLSEDLSTQEPGSNIFESVSTSYGSEKPIAVYLPGLDCFGISGVQQFEDLSERFELWRMTVKTTDRSSFGDLVNKIVEFIEEVSKEGNREVTLIGESFGGQLAPVVALKLQARKKAPLHGLVLVNPATSFDNTNWDQLGPLLASLRFVGSQQQGATPYSIAGGMALSFLIPDSTQLRGIVEAILGVPVQSLDTISDLIGAMNAGFGTLNERLPAESVAHRVSMWLPVGAQLLTDERLANLHVSTLVVAGEDDNFLPSKDEAERLTKILPKCEKLIVKGAGHFVLDNRVNLTEAIVYSDIDPLKLRSDKKYDPILDWKLPEKEELQKTIDNVVEPFRRLTSPVFFSTDNDGKRWTGLGKLSVDSNPIVFVANHQLFGLDLGMIIAQLIEDRGIVARGLAHPIVMDADQARPNQPDSPGITDKPVAGSPNNPSTFRKFGAVKVSPRNYYRLLKTGQNVLLFPGGVREVFHGKDEAHTLFWPETPDFVRTAARFNATIVPISAVGAADSVNILVDGPDMANLPFGIGKGLVEQSANITAARFNKKNGDELFVPPFFVPKGPPARHYFVFGKALTTTDVDHGDSKQCTDFYQEVQEELNRGFDDVLRSRELDPFKDNVQRLAFEQVAGKAAPTFSIEEMNKNLKNPV
jgi:pimeloyl-ACP methyl ester carboxylesterase/1-acyl-sn-glycerol-3-phosphate acyltransferase